MYQAKGRDCCFYIFRRWKSIIVVALIAALLMCGLDVFKTLRRWNTDKKQCEKDAIAYKEAFDIAEDRVAAYDGQIADDEKEIAVLRENPIIGFDRENIGSASVFLQFDATLNEAGELRQFPSGLMNLYSNALTDITDLIPDIIFTVAITKGTEPDKSFLSFSPQGSVLASFYFIALIL